MNTSTFTSAASPAPAADPSALQQFAWAMQRLAQMQGGSIDMLSLNASASALAQPIAPIQALVLVCQRMGLSNPKLLKQPDRVQLPLLCHTPELGWGVVVDRNPLGLWVVMTPQGSQSFEDAALKNAVALLRLGPAVDLGFGFGLFGKKDDKLTFFSHVQDTLRLYRHELIEACVASAFIGFLALAT